MTPMVFPLLGGALLGLSASLLLLFNGRVAGISGIAGGLLPPTRGELGWRLAFLAGLVAGGLLLRVLWPASLESSARPGAIGLVVAGLLVGFGTRLGSGCTSGHGVCGLARGATRSLVATLTFMATGALTVFVVRHVLGGGQ
ncbi:YeeE/YedE family protein [Vitiosangium sp. GDMCC 1.1324]|uniref:YeeE/YedE family protein n=1 Tax=Vitiosangium sp. (strain GDMCC 1.1324) TaxID=2138576 RepID=UPI000D389FF9|nr:YeeE/YedE family protein [Vitiosangium sp. GDMCC 1.1324]PTL82766.1 YeeE/YedE family protein [Vitiosangium sp. GDMCC 1.1324]